MYIRLQSGRLTVNALMKVSKWGNSLAVRLPAKLVRELGLKEGDTVSQDVLRLRKIAKEEALEQIKQTRWTLPEGYRFDRDEANAR